MRSELSDKQRLLHVIESIEAVENYFAEIKNYEDFKANSLVLFATIKQLEIIGEAINHIDVELLLQQPQIPWNKIIGMRNMLVHEYFGVNPEVIWGVVKHNLFELKSAVEIIASNC